MNISDMTNLFVGYNIVLNFKVLVCAFDEQEAEEIVKDYAFDSLLEGDWEIKEYKEDDTFDCDCVLTKRQNHSRLITSCPVCKERFTYPRREEAPEACANCSELLQRYSTALCDIGSIERLLELPDYMRNKLNTEKDLRKKITLFEEAARYLKEKESDAMK